MLGKKKKKNIEVIGKQEGERQKNINEPKFQIKVYKTLGKDVCQEIDSFYADQKKDGSGSMFLVNDDHNFKESLAISKNEAIVKLKERLDIKNLSVEAQQKAIDAKIVAQEKRIRSIEGGVIKAETSVGETKPLPPKSSEEKPELEKVNIIEENKRLRQLKVLRYVVNHSETGSYDSIDGQGFRQRYYLYDEGALIPMFWDSKTTSLYVAVDTAIKFYKADQDLINADYADENRDKWLQFGKGLMVVVFAILFLANMYIFIQNLDRSNSLDLRSETMTLAIEDSNFGQCIKTISTTNEGLMEIVEEYRAKNNESNINVVTTDLT